VSDLVSKHTLSNTLCPCALQADLVLELHSSLVAAERLVAALQAGARASGRTRDAAKAGLVHDNTDLLKARLLPAVAFRLRIAWTAQDACKQIQSVRKATRGRHSRII
jgi:hypothetical protein